MRTALGLVLVVATIMGLHHHYGERKEDWRGAATLVAAGSRPDDPIFFVHFGAQLPFDRYFTGPQPRIGLPADFRWEDGYTARYRVTLDDVQRRVPPILAGRSQAWVVLSHDAGRGGEKVLAFLDRWGNRAADHSLQGIRVVRFQRGPGAESEVSRLNSQVAGPG